jgi:hypothetical protein
VERGQQHLEANYWRSHGPMRAVKEEEKEEKKKKREEKKK